MAEQVVQHVVHRNRLHARGVRLPRGRTGCVGPIGQDLSDIGSIDRHQRAEFPVGKVGAFDGRLQSKADQILILLRNPFHLL